MFARLAVCDSNRLSPKQKQVLFAIVLSLTTSICKNVTMKCSIEFIDPGYYYLQWDAPLSESI
jgi:hypothetical protein